MAGAPAAGTTLDPRTTRAASVLAIAFAIAVGMAVTLSVRGYQFGKSNHTVYLLEAVHWLNPQLLNHDWYVTHTLQYHLVFGALTRWLMAAGLERPGFLLGYLLTLIAMHGAWIAIVLRLGGTVRTYLLSVIFFYLSAGGTALGAFQFDQDGSFLPSNVANVAMLWGIWLWMRGNRGWAGAALGAAALWHINHAAVGIGLFAALSLWEAWRPTRHAARWTRPQLYGAAVLLLLGCVNLVPALLAKLGSAPATVSLDEFVRLYVFLRHPHHYGPTTWAPALWICFLWSSLLAIPAAVRARRHGTSSADPAAWIQASRVFVIFWLLLIVGLLGAGFWFVSDTLIQLAVYRFTIYVQLLACVAVAWWVLDSGAWPRGSRVTWGVLAALGITFALLGLLRPQGALARASQVVHDHPGPLVLFTFIVLLVAIYASGWRAVRGGLGIAIHGIGLVMMCALIGIGWGRWMGLNLIPEDDAQYLEVAHWARQHTPVDTIFLVPANEQAFRLEARRAIYINFKGVPQLRREIGTWRDRLRQVLDLDDLSTLPRGFDHTLAAIGERYESLPASHLVDVARRHQIRYLLVNHPIPALRDGRLVYQSSGGEYFLYDLNPSPSTESGNSAAEQDNGSHHTATQGAS